jgi:hypothetical protein
MHKMHREYKNVEKEEMGLLLCESDACVKKEVECSS